MMLKLLKIFPFFQLFLLCGYLSAQHHISGVIYDSSTKTILSDAHIEEKDASTIYSSNPKGEYSLKVKSTSNIKLHFSYIGYKDTTIIIQTLTQDTIIDIYLRQYPTKLSTVFVTANRHEQNANEIIGRINIIKQAQIEQAGITNSDELLYLVSGIHSDRDMGIFSRNAGVTMRGLNSTSRVLVLLNGAKLNKADGGGINWNRIDPELVEHIEIVKGPVSAIYGGNAMGGVINIITKKPDSPLSVQCKTSAGSFNTIGNSLLLNGTKTKDDRGFYWSLHNFLRRGDGYISSDELTQTLYDTTNFIKEVGITGMVGYSFSKKSQIEMEYNYWDDIRSDGIKVFQDLGSYNKFTTHFLRGNYNLKSKNHELSVSSYYQHEHYFRQNENIGKNNGKYKWYDSNSYRSDNENTISYSYKISNIAHMISGIDIKHGSINANEVYYTSTDITNKQGTMNQYAVFGVFDYKIFKEKLLISTGFRFDFAQFLNAAFSIEDASSITSFMVDKVSDFPNENWNALSPKIGLKYFLNKNISFYTSYSGGFHPPMLDDMCTNRSISKGFKIANPSLKPEFLYTTEIGTDFAFFKKLNLNFSFYHSTGTGFQYFVATGDSIDTGSDSPKPVLIRDNIGEAEIIGGEASVVYELSKYLSVYTNYSYNHSIITKFSNSKYENKNLEGKFLMEVPAHLFNLSAFINLSYFIFSTTYIFNDKQWYDDENTSYTPAYGYWNAKISTAKLKKINVSVQCQDIFNRKYINNKGYYSPGRFFMISIKYQFKPKNTQL